MEPLPVYYKSHLYMLTKNMNKVSKNVSLRATNNIQIEGKTILQNGVSIRGDLGQVKIGTYVVLRDEVILRPTYSKAGKKLKYIEMKIGDNVYIDRNCVISAAKIGNNVHIGKNCIIGHRVVIYDNTKILDNSIIPADVVIPPFTCWGGSPATCLGGLPETIEKVNSEMTKSYYKNFIGLDPDKVDGAAKATVKK